MSRQQRSPCLRCCPNHPQPHLSIGHPRLFLLLGPGISPRCRVDREKRCGPVFSVQQAASRCRLLRQHGVFLACSWFSWLHDMEMAVMDMEVRRPICSRVSAGPRCRSRPPRRRSGDGSPEWCCTCGKCVWSNLLRALASAVSLSPPSL